MWEVLLESATAEEAAGGKVNGSSLVIFINIEVSSIVRHLSWKPEQQLRLLRDVTHRTVLVTHNNNNKQKQTRTQL